MHGLIGKIIAVPGERDELAAILLEVAVTMPDCLSYVLALDRKDADALWLRCGSMPRTLPASSWRRCAPQSPGVGR